MRDDLRLILFIEVVIVSTRYLPGHVLQRRLWPIRYSLSLLLLNLLFFLFQFLVQSLHFRRKRCSERLKIFYFVLEDILLRSRILRLVISFIRQLVIELLKWIHIILKQGILIWLHHSAGSLIICSFS